MKMKTWLVSPVGLSEETETKTGEMAREALVNVQKPPLELVIVHTQDVCTTANRLQNRTKIKSNSKRGRCLSTLSMQGNSTELHGSSHGSRSGSAEAPTDAHGPP